MDATIIWDLADDPDGNVQTSESTTSRWRKPKMCCWSPQQPYHEPTSGLPTAFGWTSTGRHSRSFTNSWTTTLELRPVTAYDVPASPKKKRRKR